MAEVYAVKFDEELAKARKVKPMEMLDLAPDFDDLLNPYGPLDHYSLGPSFMADDTMLRRYVPVLHPENLTHKFRCTRFGRIRGWPWPSVKVNDPKQPRPVNCSREAMEGISRKICTRKAMICCNTFGSSVLEEHRKSVQLTGQKKASGSSSKKRIEAVDLSADESDAMVTNELQNQWKKMLVAAQSNMCPLIPNNS
ncbi:OLC1v1008014C1 [Oldenlandia corymbosa var. corymbosa]|uniref:OLC1v1008014C1 n=1 Tax=Oldenlandia corymbosa var. corymbosa TaxID=529605 RepID=A0AAV1DN49_OLDCO|nr:OLC1v1008014C1 [Oldenlandia corymbosa var. corymbosa]